MSRARAACGIAFAATAAALAAGCHKNGCVGGDDGTCQPPTACPAIRYTCDPGVPGTVRLTRLDGTLQRMRGPKAFAAVGDFMLENDLVRAVLDAPDHPQYLAPSGGTILDFAPVDTTTDTTSGDQINSVYQAAGLLPRDAVHYETLEPDDKSLLANNPYVAVVFRGHLEGDKRVTVVTRYELRACEPGLRVRSDLYNGAPDPGTLYLTDGFFWGDQTLLPFVPGTGLGFRAPDIDLLHIDRAWRQWPFVAARSQSVPDVSYAVVPCDHDQAAGFNSTTLSAAGVPLAPTLPGDGFSHERFILATPGVGLAPAVAEALHVRSMVHGEPAAVTVTGRVVSGGVPFDSQSGKAASLLFYEPAVGADPDDETRRTPWSEAVPGPDGTFQVTLPPNRSYRVQPYAFGKPAAPATSFVVGTDAADLGDLTLTASAHLLASVVTTPGGTPMANTFAELVIIPADANQPGPAPSLYGLFPGCSPMLGPPHGKSPACNRSLRSHPDGTFDLLLPPGTYFVYATRGPFATLDRAKISLGPGAETRLPPFVVQDLPQLLHPSYIDAPDLVSGDFHVHGAASYDSSIDDESRVESFLAAGVDVVIATDHDVVTNYASTLTSLGVANRMVVIPGVEQTPNILWFDVPGADFPKTLGHFNFWPLATDPTAPRNGAPWDELREPGQLMDDMSGLFVGQGVRQLNHPYMVTKLGRDQGFLKALGYDPHTPIAPGASFAADVLLRAPGGRRRNIDWDVQEVMTGASRADWLRYRALWFSMLSQGFLRAGAANSDTHSLGLEQLGYPRNLVFGAHRTALDSGTFDVDAFDADVRAGHMVGTNGPVLDVSIQDTTSFDGSRRPGLDSFVVTPSASLTVHVAAAPWIPFTEVRIYVNGVLAKTLVATTADPSTLDHFGTALATFNATVPLATLLPSMGDAWIVVEAGLHQDYDVLDTDGDGLPDLPDADLPSRPQAEMCHRDANGQLDSEDYCRFDLEAIAPGVWPTAFSNPFFLDLDGGGWKAPGLPPQ
jgi:hypothetical protein